MQCPPKVRRQRHRQRVEPVLDPDRDQVDAGGVDGMIVAGGVAEDDAVVADVGADDEWGVVDDDVDVGVDVADIDAVDDAADLVSNALAVAYE